MQGDKWLYSQNTGEEEMSAVVLLCVCEREKGSLEAQKNQESKRVHACAYEGSWDMHPSDEGLGCPMRT